MMEVLLFGSGSKVEDLTVARFVIIPGICGETRMVTDTVELASNVPSWKVSTRLDWRMFT
jgi:hypothetical protein